MGRVGRIIIERAEPPDKVGFLKHRPVTVELIEVNIDDLLRKIAIARKVDVECLWSELDGGVGEGTTVETAKDPVGFVLGRM